MGYSPCSQDLFTRRGVLVLGFGLPVARSQPLGWKNFIWSWCGASSGASRWLAPGFIRAIVIYSGQLTLQRNRFDVGDACLQVVDRLRPVAAGRLALAPESAQLEHAVHAVGDPERLEQFAAIVARLCPDLPALRASKQELRSRVQASPLFDGVDLSRQLEQAFLAMQTVASPAL